MRAATCVFCVALFAVASAGFLKRKSFSTRDFAGKVDLGNGNAADPRKNATDPMNNGAAGPPLAPVAAAVPAAGSSFEAWLRAELPRIPKLGVRPLPYVLAKSGCGAPGLVLEFGVHTGFSINKIADTCPTRPVAGFDSFEGLPEEWVGSADGGKAREDFSLKGKMPPVRGNVQLNKGWFSDTLPAFLKQPSVAAAPAALVNVDCDLYSSTSFVLEALNPKLQNGTVIVFDELVNYPTYREHELKALHEWSLKHQRQFAWLGALGEVHVDNPPQHDGEQAVAIIVLA